MNNTENTFLSGKTAAVTGCTGGLGRELCFKLAELGVNLIMLDRNPKKSKALAEEILRRFSINITRITTELEDIESVKLITEDIIELGPDIFIANAGAYAIPRYKCNGGYDNIFQINFVSHYYMASRFNEEIPTVKIVTVGSIAHTYSKIDKNDIDFSTRKGSALPYGNSKRFLMLSLAEKFESHPERLSIVHPGISFTNITNHYPKLVFALIKHPMKLIFMKPKKAALCILEGIFKTCDYGSWIGPEYFGIWGRPKMQKLKAIFTQDSEKAFSIAEEIYSSIK